MKSKNNDNFSKDSPRFDSSEMLLSEQYPGFKCYIPEKKGRNREEGETIHEGFSIGPPSTGAHRDYYWGVEVKEVPSPQGGDGVRSVSALVSAGLSVDDLGQFSMGSLFISLPPQGPSGGSPGQSGEASAEFPPGFYIAKLSYDNIDFKEEYNRAFMEFTLNVGAVKIVPDENPDEPCDCDPCDCDCDCEKEQEEGASTEQGGSSRDTYQIRASTPRDAILMGASSSAGRRVNASSNKVNMLWQVNFGIFRGLGGVPGGMLEIAGETFSSSLWSVKSLCYNHPMASLISKSKDAPYIGAPNTMMKVSCGARIETYLSGGDGESVFGVA